ncbi:oligoribonuclease [Corallococcus interemptor]|uniref:Oligoribonuclease n=3 Tax=Corallococcus TaxID=83461 RepID=H8MWP2_CORCM|nr:MULTISPECIES: oligoribonuclease [Corallococcus]RKH45503.1 oligoribonuclease [Corallococcus sp. AB050B]AFE09709.1 oligoribonuclease [Corallococcus coralloides DSM 2259]MBN8470506.1 oligoribonuclease [Corallococcus exiguus]MBN9681172.1 oligoribonuclease [Corallococcus sp. NCSPR001]MBZ4331029.1 oligoribonuclease [Corallococcus sp. AS-1-12]
MASRDIRFVWLDLEMTGLDPNTCGIIEVGIIVTGPDLRPLGEFERVVWQPEEMLQRMEPVVREMHTKNGLLEKVRASTSSLRVVEREVTSFIADYCDLGEGILAGNSIHTDRRFLIDHMPMVDRYLHYRMVDVTSLKVITRAWYPALVEPRKPPSGHTALADLRSSISELQYYRDVLFRATPG